MSVIFAEEAERDLEDITDWLLQQDPQAAKRLVLSLRQACEELEDNPLAYPVPVRLAELGLRRRVLERYLIFYQVGEGRIEIARILHGARDHDALLMGRSPLGT